MRWSVPVRLTHKDKCRPNHRERPLLRAEFRGKAAHINERDLDLHILIGTEPLFRTVMALPGCPSRGVRA